MDAIRRLSPLLLMTLLLVAACQDSTFVHTTAPIRTGSTADADNVPDAGDTGADPEPEPTLPPHRFVVQVSPEAPEAVQWAAEDVRRYFEAMGLEATLDTSLDAVACEPGSGRIVFVGEGVGPTWVHNYQSPQTFAIDEERCEGGVRVELGGADGLLARQYAAYEFLHAVGVRFFHPEQEYVPTSPQWPAQPIVRLHTPDFKVRSVSLHLTHPLELGDAFRNGDESTFEEVRRYIDWQVKNLSSYGKSGVGTGELAGYGRRRGFPREAGLTLHSQQQGSSAIIDPDDPRPWQEQLGEAIDAAMGDDPENYPAHFGFTFNPSEFTEIDDRQALAELTFIADTFAERYPNTRLTCVNHGTKGTPTEHYGIRYYDLPKLAPANLGVRVHPLMFYDLFRPAPVYGNTDFNYLYDFMADQYQIRPLWYFPEAAWWLTFDIAVPLYLPITLEARHRDIQGIKFMLEGKLEGHHVFGTGHEWGYWQNEYCSLRMSADVNYGYRDCLADIASPAGEYAPVVVEVLEKVIDLQIRDILYGDLLPYLVGTDPETEVAAAAGIDFHPLPPAIPDIMAWSEDQTAAWLAHFPPLLEAMAQDYADLVARLNAIEGGLPDGGLPWIDEIRDGIEVTGLRARHALHVYGAAVTFRRSLLTGDQPLRNEADSLLRAATADTEAALAVIARREAGYRYAPLSRSIAGGPDGTEDDNWTVYTYRYLNRTHHATYYTRIDQLVQAAIDGANTPVQVTDALIGPDEQLEARVLDFGLTDVTFDFGDGVTSTERNTTHTYDTPGIYTLAVTGLQGAQPFALSGDVAALAEEHGSTGAVRVLEPSGASLIAGLIPGLIFGRIDAATLAMGFDVRGDGTVALGAWTALEDANDGPLTSVAADAIVPIATSGEVVTQLTVRGARLRFDPEASTATLTGDLPTEDVVNALVEIGGFEASGARGIVAATLGYTVDSLPETVAFVLEYTVP